MPATAFKPASAPFKTLEFLPLDPDVAHEHAEHMLRHYTDPSDLHADLDAGCDALLVVDARSRESYAHAHIPGAINFPHREMDEQNVKRLPKNLLIVTYCDGIGCNASTKAALKLSRFGFHVKELIGGIDWWVRDGYAVTQGVELKSGPSCGC